MSKNESIARLTDEILEEQLVDILERYQLINWKQAGLEVLIKYAQREKEYWENSNNPHNTNLANDFTRVIEIAETLTKTKRIS